MSPTDWKLIALAVFAVGILVLLVTRLKVNAFAALLLAGLFVGGGAALMGVTYKPSGATEARALTMLDVGKIFQDGMGATLGGIAAIIGFGTMLGKLLAESGGAEVLAKRFNAFFGPQRVGWCIMALALAVGLTTWFAVGLILLLPILLTLTRETGQPFLRLALPLLSFLSVMHGVMPPHPGPVIEFVQKTGALREGLRLPGFGLTLFAILLPVLLMLVATAVELVKAQAAPGGAVAAFLLTHTGVSLTKTAMFIGSPTIALLIAVLFGLWALGTNCGHRPPQLMKFTEDCIGAVGMTLLVVGGGGGFARVLKEVGVAGSMGAWADMMHLSPLLYGWLVAAFIRVATGSATVSITTASGLLIPVVAAHPGTNVELLVVCIGCGSLFLSHLNDGGFWIVKDCLGLSVQQTLRTWTVCETIVGLAGLGITLLVSLFV
jgi:GntP family gluconate:H+ symporter